MRRNLLAFAPTVALLAVLPVAASVLAAQDAARTVYAESPAVWFEAHRVGAVVSPDGRLAALSIRWPEALRFVDLRRGTVVPITPGFMLDSVSAAAFTHLGEPAVRGWLPGGAERGWGWYTHDRAAVRRLPIPADAEPRWSAGGTVAYTRRRPHFGRPTPDSTVHVQSGEGWRAFTFGGRVTGLAWLPNGRALLALTSDRRGVSTLHRADVESGRIEVVAGDLDADPSWSPVAVDRSGRRAYVALAGPTAAPPEERHVPDADRDLDIYEIDLGSGARRAVIATPAEEYGPAVAGDHLYWTRTESEMSVAVGPSTGGPLRDAVAGAMLPSWRPDGQALGFSYGGFRAGDWVLNWEGGLVEIDTAGRPRASTRAMITGLHEDFQPVWSPRGRWIAYHSHRSTTPVVLYSGPGTTDDIWLRPVGRAPGEPAVEIRLTDGEHEVGAPEWSPDGTRVLFTAALPNGGRGRSYAGLITIDTITGRATGQSRLPLGPIPGAEKAAWSPVSDEIAIQAREAPGRHAIWLVRADGANPRRLVQYETHTYSGVDWTAEGKTIIYSAMVDGRMQLFAIPSVVEGAGEATPIQLTHDAWNVLHPAVSPDGRLVAATRIRHRKAILRLPLGGAAGDDARERALREIDAARRRFEAAIRSNDAAAMTGVYAPDAFYFPPRGEPVRGREAIGRALERPARDYEIVHHVLEVDVRGDIAYEIGRWIRRRRNGGDAIGGGGYLWIWKRQPVGTWAIWREVWNDGP